MSMKYAVTMIFLTGILTGCTMPESPADEVSTEVIAAEPVIEEVLTETEALAYEAERMVALAEAEMQKERLNSTEKTVMVSGEFLGIAPGHNTEGSVMVKDLGGTVLLELSEDFAADKGPDLYVILTQEQPLTGEDPLSLDTEKVKKISPLLQKSGAQMYEVSKADFEKYGYGVGIWCNKYNVVFGAAVLQ